MTRRISRRDALRTIGLGCGGALLAGSGQARAQFGSRPRLVYVEHDPSSQFLDVTGMAQPNGLLAHPATSNPIVRGHNVYAPHLLRQGRQWLLYYGGWQHEGQIHDHIYLAVSDDLFPEGPWHGHQAVIRPGQFIHVNDPSVERRAPDDWVMAYTVAVAQGDVNRIGVSFSRDGLRFEPAVATPETFVTVEGPPFRNIARPSLVWSGSRWKLWFDAQVGNEETQSYLAESVDELPLHFRLVKQYPQVHGMASMLEADVRRIQDRYVAVVQRRFLAIQKLESFDGVNFREVGTMLDVNNPALSGYALNTPTIIHDNERDELLGIAYGMDKSGGHLNRFDIGFAYTQYDLDVLSPPDVWHLHSQAVMFDTAVQTTSGHQHFTRVRIKDSLTGAVLIDEPVDAQPGDRWHFEYSPPPPPREHRVAYPPRPW